MILKFIQLMILTILFVFEFTGTVNLNRQDYYGKTPLYWAAYKGHQHCIEELLKFGALTNISCRHGGTPLHAVASLYPQCALILIKVGIPCNVLYVLTMCTDINHGRYTL